MRTMDDMLRDPENGNGYVVPGDIKHVKLCGCDPTHSTAYVVESGPRVRYAKTKETALQIASELLNCDTDVTIKRIELS